MVLNIIVFSVPLYRMKSAYESYREAGFDANAIRDALRRKYTVGFGKDEPINDYSLVRSGVSPQSNSLLSTGSILPVGSILWSNINWNTCSRFPSCF